MNIWKWILFYIYSGIAFGALIGRQSGQLLELFEPTERENHEQRARIRGRITEEAMQLGNLMADATTTAIVAGYNHDLIQGYENARAHNAAALEAAEPANKQGV
jgi:uncharacterized protein YdbL (DUF1318 family)